MEVAASIARFIALADLLVTKYSKIVDAWKDAPSAIVSIRDYLRTLKPIVVCLEELKALSSNQLVRNGLKIAAFKRTMKSLEDLADDLLKTPSDVKLWARTKWTFGKNEKARELGRSLDSDIGVFSLVLLLAVQKTVSDIQQHVVKLQNIANTQSTVHTPKLEAQLDITQKIYTRMGTPERSFIAHSQQSRISDSRPQSTAGPLVLQGGKRIGGHQSTKAIACSKDCARC